jgi:hypothetical protein
MKNDTISNIFNPSEYLKEMADEETGRDEREPYQLELPMEARVMSEAEVIAIFNMQQKEINELRLKLDEVYALINRIWGAR